MLADWRDGRPWSQRAHCESLRQAESALDLVESNEGLVERPSAAFSSLAQVEESTGPAPAVNQED